MRTGSFSRAASSGRVCAGRGGHRPQVAVHVAACQDVLQHALGVVEGVLNAGHAQLGDAWRQADDGLAHSLTRRSRADQAGDEANRVVLPAPLGPMIPRISPRPTLRLTSDAATTPPKEQVSPESSRAWVEAGAGAAAGAAARHAAAGTATPATAGASSASRRFRSLPAAASARGEIRGSPWGTAPADGRWPTAPARNRRSACGIR